jgi:hypothetical protein
MNARSVPFRLEIHKPGAKRELRSHLGDFSTWWGHLYNHACVLAPYTVTHPVTQGVTVGKKEGN